MCGETIICDNCMLNRQRENLHGVVYHLISQINILDSSDQPYLFMVTSRRMILIIDIICDNYLEVYKLHG